MDPGFAEYAESLHRLFEALIQMPPVSAAALPRILPKECVYLFSENEIPLYVGRTRKLRQRLRNHCGDSSGQNQAVFAFKLAREETGNIKAGYSKENSRKALIEVVSFAGAFANAKKRIRNMQLRFVEVKDPLSQALLEIYASFVLKTRYNDFETH